MAATRRSIGRAGERATAPGRDECEAENEHGGDVLDEPHDREEDETELGWAEHLDQTLAPIVNDSWHVDGGEPEMGWSGIATGWRENDAVDDREGDDEREAIDEREQPDTAD